MAIKRYGSREHIEETIARLKQYSEGERRALAEILGNQFEAYVSDHSAACEALAKALDEIVSVASGETQVAIDDTDEIAWIDKYARAALAAHREGQ